MSHEQDPKSSTGHQQEKGWSSEGLEQSGRPAWANDPVGALRKIAGLRGQWFSRAGGGSQLALDAIRIAQDALRAFESTTSEARRMSVPRRVLVLEGLVGELAVAARRAMLHLPTCTREGCDCAYCLCRDAATRAFERMRDLRHG